MPLGTLEERRKRHQYCSLSVLGFFTFILPILPGYGTWIQGADRSFSSIPRGTLVAVVGTVGSGKSSFLSAMLGELELSRTSIVILPRTIRLHSKCHEHVSTFTGELTRLRGEISVTGKLAYIPQQAWIQNLSVRDNITFGRAFDRQWYEKVSFFR